ncbi:hypothetical protein V2O64_14500 [Verrucomicrobiaceae bacterium 227]
MKINAIVLLFLSPITLVAETTPLRVDINSEARTDMLTGGWENWLPPKDGTSRVFGGVTVALKPVEDHGPLRFEGSKAIIIHGVTLGADGVVADGGLEIQLAGLSTGRHTFVGYHHDFKEDTEPYTLSLGAQTQAGIIPSKDPRHNDEVGTSFIEFEAIEGEPTVIRLSGERVVLSGFAIDLSNPRKKALQPSPNDLERHADGDSGYVPLKWKSADLTVHHRLFLASDRDPLLAGKKLNETRFIEVKGSSYNAPIAVHDSLQHYIWRVDSVDAAGKVTKGDVWRFRVRHLAFPTAEGYGRFAIGGRGGRVIHVTNLNDSGAGSLREAVESTGSRTVVFDVSGLISLKSKLVFRREHEFLTIAGQSAPGKGICIRNYTFGGLGGEDTIVRYVRLRLGDLTGKTMDGMGFASCDHCIIDHCSISWTIDEAFSSRGARNITFQRNLISEALNIANHKKYGKNSAHGFAGSIGGNVGSFHHSLLAHNAGRNWSLAGATDQTNRHAGRLDIRNMLVYNWRHRTTDGGAREVNFVNNYYKPGPATTLLTYLNPQFENPQFGPQQYYVEGNLVEGVTEPEGPLGPFKGMAVKGRQDAPTTVPEPFFEHYVKTQSAMEAYENVLADVGCNIPKLDDHDKRVLRETREGSTTYQGSRSGLPGLPDSQEDVGGWEDYPEIHRPADWDTDRDGMPNHWEIKNGLDPDKADDGSQDPDGDGFTNLENYLNSLESGS